MLASRLKTSLALAALVVASSASAQEPIQPPSQENGQQNTQTSTPEQRFAAWKLQAATGVPGPAELKELEGLLQSVKAEGGSPQLLTSLTESVDALRVRLAPKQAGKAKAQVSAAAEREVLRLALEKAIAEHNVGFIDSLGVRAIPALREMAAAWDGSPTSGEQQPALYWLAKASAPEGLNVALELMRSKSFLLKRSTLKTLERQNTFYREGVWRPEGETDWRLVRPEWEQILHLALEDPAVEPSALKKHFSEFIRRGQLPRSLGGVALDAWVTFHAANDVVPSEGLWYLDLAADSVSNRLNDSAAYYVPMHNDQLALQMSKSSDYGVRKTIAKTILCREVVSYVDRELETTASKYVAVPMTRAILEAFTALATDDEPNVRRRCKDNLKLYLDQFEGAPFSAEMLGHLFPLVDDKEIQQQLARSIQYLPEADRLAGVEAMVKGLVARNERSLVFSGQLDPANYGLSPKDDFFRLLDVWHAYGFFEKSDAESSIGMAVYAMNNAASGAALETEPFIERARSWGFVEALAPVDGGKKRRLLPWIAVLSDEARARIVRIIHTETQPPVSDELIANCAGSIDRKFIKSRDVLLQLIEDETAPRGARLWASRQFLRDHRETADSSQLATIASLVASSKSASEAFYLSRMLHGEKEQEFARLLAAQPLTTAEQILALSVSSLTPETLNALWPKIESASWTVSEFTTNSIGAIVVGLAERSQGSIDPRLAQIDFSLDDAWTGLFHAARTTKNPVLLPLIREVILRPDFRDTYAWQMGTGALAAYMNDEAGAILLEAARLAPHADARNCAMAALAEITQWREAAAAWEKSASASAKRSEAIAELVEILRADAQPIESRAAAIRGLGLLDAVEELPHIVRALTSESEAIQEAARAAMARMEK